MERLTMYSKKPCVQCDATERKLDQLDIPYDVVSLEDLTDEQVQAFRDEGLLQAPVVEFAGERWSGFRPDKLGEVALKLANQLP